MPLNLLPVDRRRSNPFATRHTRPGAVPPLDPAGAPLDVGVVLVALERHRRVAIVGPHGTGKSTLLAALADTLAADRRPAEVVRLRRRKDALLLLGAVGRGAADATLLVDGWERLGRPMTLIITAIARLRGRRMVVTTHRANGMPVAVRTAGTLRLLTAIAASGGSSRVHRSSRSGQRVWKGQPEGGLTGLGSSPDSTIRSRDRARTGSGSGTAEIRACV